MDIQNNVNIKTSQISGFTPAKIGNISLKQSDIDASYSVPIDDQFSKGLSAPTNISVSFSGLEPQTIIQSSGAQTQNTNISLGDLTEFPKQLVEVASDGTTKTVTFIYDTDKRSCLTNLTLVGSWDANTGKYTNKWERSEIPMQPDGKGRWIAQVGLQDDGSNYQWGVKADSPSGPQAWAIFEEGNLPVDMSGDKPVNTYAPTTYTTMGGTRDGENANFKFWAPHAKDVKVRVWDDSNPDFAVYVPLKKDDQGMWNGVAEGSWDKLSGKNYAFEIVTGEGKVQLKNDPYTRFLQGPQRGINVVYLHPKTGDQIHQFWKDENLIKEGLPYYHKMARFEVDDQPNAEAVYLTFKDEKGNPMDKKAIQDRLGKGHGDIVGKFHQGKMNDYWLNNVDDSGRIKMVKQGKAWATFVDGADDIKKLPGMHYQFEVYEKGKDGQLRLVGDDNNNKVLETEEARNTGFNDPFSNQIFKDFGSMRFGILQESNFDFKNDHAPRVTDKNKMIIYQMHVGSIFGDNKNVDKSTFKDVIERLEYFKDLGVNTIEMLPSNSYEGTRDWGYIGSQTFAQAEQYGFIDDSGKWVSGTEALKKFIDTAHGMGLNVINDVVYNHWGGEFENLWNLDGEKNSYFNWKDDPEVVPGKNGNNPGVKHTDWGPMPAYSKHPVQQFITDHAMSQMDEFHFDGLRFDFTHPMHNGEWGGGNRGWELLRRINREVHFFHPKALTAAEEFPNSPIVTTPAYPNGEGGAGFDTMWNTEFQHRLVHDGSNPSILQQAARGWKTDMDKFMGHLVSHPGFATPMNSVTVISNHDEVGNADRTINVATNHQHPALPGQWARNSVRMTFGSGMLATGIPIFFQGEESMADNTFKWGRPSTWDNGWDWQNVGKNWDWTQVRLNDGKLAQFDALMSMPESQRESSSQYKALSETDKQVFDYVASQPEDQRNDAIKNIFRRMHNHFCKDIIALKKSSPAFDGDAEVHRVHTHNDNAVMAFKRKKGGDEFLVIGSLNKDNLSHYNVPLDSGKYQLVFNSDVDFYGGDNYGSVIYMDGHQGSFFDIPKGGLLVYKRIA